MYSKKGKCSRVLLKEYKRESILKKQYFSNSLREEYTKRLLNRGMIN
jgi:hypothetical protein